MLPSPYVTCSSAAFSHAHQGTGKGFVVVVAEHECTAVQYLQHTGDQCAYPRMCCVSKDRSVNE